MSSSVPGNNDSSRVSQLEKELDIAYELLRQMSMNNQVLQSDEKDDFKDRIQQAKNDSIFSIIGSLNSQIKDLENVSASMLSDLKSLDKSAELAELKELTLEIIEKEDQITKVIQESEKKANKAMRKELDEITSTIKRRGNRGDKENEKYLDEIVNSYEKVLSKVENRKSKRDERNTDKQLAETQKEIDELKGKLIEYESAQSENESNEELSSLKTLISQLESYNEVQTSNVQNLQQDTQSQIGELTSSMSQILNDITDLKAMIVNSGNNIQNTNDEVEITSTFTGNNTLMSEESQRLLAGMNNNEAENQLETDNVVAKAFNDEIKVLNNQQSDLYYKKAQMLIISNSFEESLENAFKVIELSPERLEAYTLIGNIYMTAINRCSDIGEDQFSKKLVAIAAYKMYEKSQNNQKMNEAMMFFPTTDEIKNSGYSKSKSVDLNVCWVNEEITLLSKSD